MDTRQKIVEGAEAVRLLTENPDAVYVAGWFDPMVAEHARRLSELAGNGKPLIVLVTDPPDPILCTRARAELVAALDCVAHVAVGAADTIPAKLFDQRPAEAESRAALARRVRERTREAG